MTVASIGYYVHHHGRGHLARAEAILRRVEAPVALLTSADPPPLLRDACAEVVALPLDIDMAPAGASPEQRVARGAGEAPEVLHHAPLGHRGLRRRMAQIAAWAERAPGTPLLVVDVSVEVALLGRLLGLPVVYARQHGRRTDAPHRAAYDAAVRLLAPYPVRLEDDSQPPALREKTFYAGGFSRFAGRAPLSHAEARAALGLETSSPRVAVLRSSGGDGSGPSTAQLAAAARATPGWQWTVLGERDERSNAPPNLHLAGWVDDPFPHLCAADVVVASAGQGAVSEVAAARRPLVCLPEPRPFDEQACKAQALQREGAALVRHAWPAPGAWPGLLSEAACFDPAPLAALFNGEGAARAAAFLDRLAQRYASLGADAPRS